MLHNITDKFEQTIKGMTIKVVVQGPAAATMTPLHDEIAKLFKFAESNTNQLNLFDKDDAGSDGE